MLAVLTLQSDNIRFYLRYVVTGITYPLRRE